MADPPKQSRSSLPWRAFFRESRTPVFVLGKGKRLRFANAAWEQLAGVKLADALGLVCSSRRHSTPLAAALAPTHEALAGTPDKVRRPAPPLRTGPPWWDVSFTPLAGDDGLLGLVGSIHVVGEAVPAAARKIPATVTAVRERHAGRFTLDLLSGPSAVAERFASQVRLAAQTTAPVWLVGEPGSGKETTARVVHHTGTQRERMFVSLDAAALLPYLIESLLFGHGGLGLAASERVGTLFLKEPAALPRDMQERLLDVFLEAKPGALRLICASARPAADDVAAGLLLPDFDTTLSVLELRVPPLRDRLDDLTRIVSRLTTRPLDPAAVDVLKAQAWAGNLRELAQVLAEAATAATGPILRDHLPHQLRVRAGLVPNPPAGPSPKLDALLEAVEKRMLQLALRKANNHQTEAAEMLGIWRARLWRRLEALGIPVPPQPPKPRKKGDAG